MALNLSQLTEDLESNDLDILSLALGTLARSPIKDAKLSKEAVLNLYNNILNHCNHPNADIKFLAHKAREQLYNQIAWLKSKKELEEAFKLEELNSPDTDTRQRAVLALLAKNKQDALKILVWHYLKERNPKVIASMNLGISNLDNKKMVKLLEVFLYSPDDRLRANTIEAIEILGNKEQILSLLPRLLTDKNNRVRANAIKAISLYDANEIIEHLESMIKSPELARRASALYVLKNIESLETIKLLSIAANDPFIDNRLKTIEILKRYQSNKDALVVLKRLSQDEDIEVSEAALVVLNSEKSTNKDQNTISLSEVAKKSGQKEGANEVTNIEKNKLISLEKLNKVAEELDQKIELELLALGKTMQKGLKQGLYRGNRNEEIYIFIETADKLEHQLIEKLAKQPKPILDKILKKFGIGLNRRLSLIEARNKLEDAILDIGYEAIRLALKEEIIFVGIMDKVKKIQNLFLEKIDLEAQIKTRQYVDENL